MLEHLAARNLGLIREAELDPVDGLTVITGETGAGKTLLLGALRMLLGEAVDSGMVGPFGESAHAEGLFVDDEETPVARIVPREGRSRAYRDGVIVSAASLRDELADRIQIVGQHDQMDLKRSSYVLDLLDQNMGKEGAKALSDYVQQWKSLSLLRAEQEKLGGSQLELARELDLSRYQHEEISRAAFAVGEDVALEESSSRFRNIDEIKEHLTASDRALENAADAAGELVSHLRKASSLDPGLAGLAESAETVAIATSEMARELADRFDSLVADPESADEVERRLNLLGEFRMKYGKNIEEILAFGEAAGAKAVELTALLQRATTIDQEVERKTEELQEVAQALSAERAKTADQLVKGIVGHLEEVGLGGATVKFEFAAAAPGARGTDQVDLLFSSHEQLRAGPISKVASGGELSRLILAISLGTGSDQRQTVVFDEVDSGVGGATALAMGRKLADLARTQQVLCVTHLPQVAAFADRHYVISREGSEATVSRVDGPARLEELSRMIAGLPESERGQQAAAELLEMSKS